MLPLPQLLTTGLPPQNWKKSALSPQWQETHEKCLWKDRMRWEGNGARIILAFMYQFFVGMVGF